MRSKHTYLLATVLIVVAASSVSAEVLYHVIELIPSGEKYRHSEAFSINNSGQIVGYADINTPSIYRTKPVLFDSTGNGNNINLSPDEHECGYAMSINSISQIVGYTCSHSNEDQRATLFDPTGEGNNIDLRTPDDWVSWAYSINNAGQAAGVTQMDDLDIMIMIEPPPWSYATLFDTTGNGNHKNLGTPGADWGEAYSINNKGQIVGYEVTPSHTTRATLFDPTGGGNNINLGTLPEGVESYAFSINDRGQIVGWAVDASGKEHATLFDSNGTGNNINLGTLSGAVESWAACINNAGQIVGYSDNGATLFDPTGGGNNINLNDVIPPTPVWKLKEATHINDSGWIVGCGKNPDGGEHAFLLIPVSENDLTLTIKVEPNDVGIDTVTPSVGEHKYLTGRAVDLQAKLFKKCPDVYHFDHWQGDVVDPNLPITTVIMNEDKIITAVFIAAERRCGDECHPILQGDLNRDCYINFADFAIYANQWLACTHPDCD
jgi:probable HAF family extracellular repeat protein